MGGVSLKTSIGKMEWWNRGGFLSLNKKAPG